MAAPSRPRKITSRPATYCIRHITRNPGWSSIAVLWIKIAGSRPAWLGHAAFGFCAAHGKSEPAHEGASPPTAVVQRHTRIMGHHRIPVLRSNAERRSLARVPEPAPHGRLRPITPRFAKNASLEASLQKNRRNTFIPHHDMHITPPHHYILHRTHRPTRRA